MKYVIKIGKKNLIMKMRDEYFIIKEREYKNSIRITEIFTRNLVYLLKL